MDRRAFLHKSGLAAVAAGLAPLAAAAAPPALPKVSLLGDSIRMGYGPFVKEALKGQATVFAPEENGAHTINTLKSLHLWVQKEQPALVHINCGLHDLKTLAYAAPPDDTLVPIHQYTENMARIFEFIRSYSKARIIWAMTTPVDEAKVHADHAKYQDHMRYEAAVVRYNEAAAKVCKRYEVEVNDLYAFCQANNLAALRLPDGVHYTEAGYRTLGTEVARVIGAGLKA